MVLIDEKLRFGLTEAGRVVLRGTGFVALAMFIVPAFGVLSILICVLLAALVAGFLVRPRVRIEGHLPDRVVAGRATKLTYVLRNVGRLPAYNLCVDFASLPQAIEQLTGERLVSRLGPGEAAQVTVTIRPTRRGCYRIGHPVCRSAFPFNLLWFGASRPGEESLIALPAFWRLQMPLRGLSRYAQTAGLRLAGRTGMSPEYIGSRPFMRGDSPRRIDARAWARLATPATKEYDEDWDNCAALVVDTRIPNTAARDKSGQIDELEAAVSLCASVAFTMNGSHFIDLLLVGPELHEFTGWPREARLDRIHELLAAVEPSHARPAERTTLFVLDRFREMSQVVFFLLGWTQTNRELVESAQRAGCHCAVVLIGDPKAEPVDDDRISTWAATMRVLSPQEVLSGKVKQL
jgi:uncharacterized protein (DUF58 family)